MNQSRVSLDSTVVIDVLRGNRASLERWLDRLEGSEFLICPIVDFEVRRLLHYRKATKQLEGLDEVVRRSLWLDLTAEVTNLAAKTWAELRHSGNEVGESDILISCHAAHHGAAIWTRDLRDFGRLPARVLDGGAESQAGD
jgi:predicted nucleic acid-binding protein